MKSMKNASQLGEAIEPQSLSEAHSSNSRMQHTLDLAGRIAPSDSSVFVIGETGVGKEWIARIIHERSRRRDRPFVAVNCAAIPENLAESEWFGHEEGAFTGATRRRRGQFELASGGTLFLDEIGEMPIQAQAKLLRALENEEIRRVGAEVPVPIDVRVIAATNREPIKAIESGLLRRDLFFRLGVVTLDIPPLRARPEDIPRLAQAHLDYLKDRMRRPDVRPLSSWVVEELRTYAWPGNVRELHNAIERALLVCSGREIRVEDLPPLVTAPEPNREVTAGTAPADGWESLLDEPLVAARATVADRFERRYLERVLRETNGRLRDAAKWAQVDERTLYTRMKRHGLSKEQFRFDRAAADRPSPSR